MSDMRTVTIIIIMHGVELGACTAAVRWKQVHVPQIIIIIKSA